MTASSRSVALRALERVDEGAYANLITPALLETSGLSDRDRRFVTELTYGTVRSQRACDWLIDEHVSQELEPQIRRVMRLGVYQLIFGNVAAHAAVNETTGLAPRRARGLVNAVLRRVAERRASGVEWPSLAVELSYPDWIVENFQSLIGIKRASEVLAVMNDPAGVSVREDGYVQDIASQEVIKLIVGQESGRVVDLCAAPGGKATGIARESAFVVACDVNQPRVGLIVDNCRKLQTTNVAAVVADGRRAPLPTASADAVLVDAPCSGLGALRRRPDARWRIAAEDVTDLAALQHALLTEASRLVRPGGLVVYSVCTLTWEENEGVVARILVEEPLAALPMEAPWESLSIGGRLLPNQHRDGMYAAVLRRQRQS